MARGHKEASTSQATRKRGGPWETPTASNLVTTMSIEDLRSFRQVPAAIRLEMLDDATTSTTRVTNNAVYFTREQFVVRLCLIVPSLVKQFLHFTKALLALVHPNVFRILMGCSVLNFLYQLDISLVEVFFIYTMKLRIRGRLSMLAHSPRLQFVTRFPDSPKFETKGVFLVKGPWYETPSFPRLPFNLNLSLSFLCLF